MEKLIQIRDISVQKQDKKILEDISLDIFEGEKVLIQGDSGTGKFTLLKAIIFLKIFLKGRLSSKKELLMREILQTIV